MEPPVVDDDLGLFSVVATAKQSRTRSLHMLSTGEVCHHMQTTSVTAENPPSHRRAHMPGSRWSAARRHEGNSLHTWKCKRWCRGRCEGEPMREVVSSNVQHGLMQI